MQVRTRRPIYRPLDLHGKTRRRAGRLFLRSAIRSRDAILGRTACSLAHVRCLWPKWSNGRMLCPMSGLLRRLLCGGLMASSFAIAPYVRAQEEPADYADPAEGEPPPGVVPAEPATQAPMPPNQAPMPATQAPMPPPEAHPAGPMPSLPSSAPQPNSGTDPTNPATYDPAADTDPAALNDFHDTLTPYGSWVDDPVYGTVWVPNPGEVGSDFAPYVTHGHWGLGGDGNWVWISDFNWGWAPFHYGRWVWIDSRGWAWIPGRVYAPAWVVWQTGYYDDWYVGWAPMPPTWYWYGGFAYSLWFYPPAPYVYCSSRYVFDHHVRSYVVSPARVGVVAPHMRPYVSASPTVGPGAAATAATTPSYRAGVYTRGPSMTDAHVPASVVPAQRATPDARAIAYARPVAASAGAYGPTTPRPSVVQVGQARAGSTAPVYRAAPRMPIAEIPRPTSMTPVRPSAVTPGTTASPAVRSFSPPAARSVTPSAVPHTSSPFRAAPSVRSGGGFRGGGRGR